jgi:hypothetical protein
MEHSIAADVDDQNRLIDVTKRCLRLISRSVDDDPATASFLSFKFAAQGAALFGVPDTVAHKYLTCMRVFVREVMPKDQNFRSAKRAATRDVARVEAFFDARTERLRKTMNRCGRLIYHAFDDDDEEWLMLAACFGMAAYWCEALGVADQVAHEQLQDSLDCRTGPLQ